MGPKAEELPVPKKKKSLASWVPWLEVEPNLTYTHTHIFPTFS